jgi:hypothetical protein
MEISPWKLTAQINIAAGVGREVAVLLFMVPLCFLQGNVSALTELMYIFVLRRLKK